MRDAPAPFAVSPGEGETIRGPVGGPLTFKARAEQTGGSLTVLENVVAPGEGPPLHTHDVEDEAWYVLEGTLRFRLADVIAAPTARSFEFVRRVVARCVAGPLHEPSGILV